MEISQRAQNMPQSPIRKLAKYADAAKRNGIKVYHLNIGYPVMMAPGNGFYTESGEGHDQVRMAYVLNNEDPASPMIVLRKALEEYKRI